MRYPIMRQMQNVSEALCKKRIDEARVIAVQFYYILVNTFGGVPLIKEYVSNIETGYPRATATDVYTYMIDELEDVIAAGALDASTAKKEVVELVLKQHKRCWPKLIWLQLGIWIKANILQKLHKQLMPLLQVVA